MKTIVILQPYFFPYLGYYQLINLCDKFIILDDVNYIKKGWINRNSIRGEKEPLLFTIPLKDASQNKRIKDTLIHESYDSWKEKFKKTLKTSYAKATQPGMWLFEKTIESCGPNDNISKLCLESIKNITKYLKLKTEIVESSSVYNNSHLRGQDRILDICLQEKADRYVNPIGGQELYSKETFEKAGTELKFHKILDYKYSQGLDKFYQEKEFQKNLSFLDILMFCDIKQIKELLQRYELV